MSARKRFRLDFDDAYQYVAAEKHDLTLVSFDADFDRTDRGRKTPVDVLGEPPLSATSRRRSPPALDAASGEPSAVNEHPAIQSGPHSALTGVKSLVDSSELRQRNVEVLSCWKEGASA
jgi:hypothetical protein